MSLCACESCRVRNREGEREDEQRKDKRRVRVSEIGDVCLCVRGRREEGRESCGDPLRNRGRNKVEAHDVNLGLTAAALWTRKRLSATRGADVCIPWLTEKRKSCIQNIKNDWSLIESFNLKGFVCVILLFVKQLDRPELRISTSFHFSFSHSHSHIHSHSKFTATAMRFFRVFILNKKAEKRRWTGNVWNEHS